MPWDAQKEMVRAIRDPKADYLLAVKQNQPALPDALQEMFALEREEDWAESPHDMAQTVNGGHGRVETRTARVIGDPEFLRYVDPKGAWPDLQSLVEVEAIRRMVLALEAGVGPGARKEGLEGVGQILQHVADFVVAVFLQPGVGRIVP